MAKSYLLLLLKFLMILLGVVWVSIWFLKPTQIWTRKWKEAEEAARSTVFGSSGLGFVVYSFPIIVFVMIGLVYLHFKPQEERGRGRRGRWVSNPIIVNGFIGVVSGMEVVVIMIFILFLGWTLYIRLSNDYNKMMPLPGKSLNRWQYMTFRTATRCGLLAEACLGLLLFPVTRGMNVFRLFGIQFEASVRYHIWLGNFMLFFASLHGVGTLFIWGIQNMLQHQMVQWQKSGRIYLAGEITLVTGLVIWITSLPQVRRKRFEIFYYTHHLYIIFIIFFLFHTGDRHFFLVLPTIFIFVIERLLRIIESTPQTCILSARIFPSKAIQLILPKEPGLKYTPTSIILIKIPSISRFQWHSFSLASSSMVDDDTMSIIIKCDGTWTNSLFHIIQHQTTIPVSVQGPYGPPSTQFISSKYDSLVLVGGGIGVTPFLSMLQEIWSITTNSFPTQIQIQLVYIIKKTNSISILNSILTNKNTNLKLKIYVTQETQSSSEMIRQVETVHFKTGGVTYTPKACGSSLLKAAIIGFTCFLFFLLLVTFSRVFLHRPSSLVDLVIIFAFFLSIIISVMVFWVLRLKSLRKQHQLMECNRGKEISLQSNPNLDELELHFGARPDFHDIFSKFAKERGGSYVGVFVCGPEKMKESVASACRGTNFHFHSLNFTL